MTVSIATTKAVGPTLPNGTVKRLATGAKPSPGRRNARLDASTTGRPCAASLCTSARSSGPCVSCGRGKFVTMTATIATGTISARMAAIASALLDHVSERMPPSDDRHEQRERRA